MEEEAPSSGHQDGFITVLTGQELEGKLYLILNKNNKNNISVLTVHNQITGRVMSSVLLFSTTSIMMALSSMMSLAITPSQLFARLETEKQKKEIHRNVISLYRFNSMISAVNTKYILTYNLFMNKTVAK